MKSCTNHVNFTRLLWLLIKLFKFEIQKCGQILCAHKPYFLMPGHIFRITQQPLNLFTICIAVMMMMMTSVHPSHLYYRV